jgi:hypothetical protein
VGAGYAGGGGGEVVTAAILLVTWSGTPVVPVADTVARV